MRTALVLTALLVLASVAVAPGATATHCFPEEGPFDRCHWYCQNDFPEPCEVVVIGGQVWSKTVCRVTTCV